MLTYCKYKWIPAFAGMTRSRISASRIFVMLINQVSLGQLLIDFRWEQPGSLPE